jgi:hypothetical protein
MRLALLGMQFGFRAMFLGQEQQLVATATLFKLRQGMLVLSDSLDVALDRGGVFRDHLGVLVKDCLQAHQICTRLLVLPAP